MEAKGRPSWPGELASAQAAGIDRATFYEAADDSPADNFGALTQSFAPKFDYQVFSMWHSMAGAELRTTITPNETAVDPEGGSARWLRSSGGTVDVLVYNYDATGPTGGAGQPLPNSLSHPVSVSVTGLPSGRHYRVSRTMVDPDDNPSRPSRSGTWWPRARSSSPSPRPANRWHC